MREQSIPGTDSGIHFLSGSENSAGTLLAFLAYREGPKGPLLLSPSFGLPMRENRVRRSTQIHPGKALLPFTGNHMEGHSHCFFSDAETGGFSMWLYTKLGFFSIVYKTPCTKDELLVRTRCRQDLEALSKKLSQGSGFKGAIIESTDSDYAYRMVVPRSVLAAFMADLMKNLDYANFKGTIPYNDRLRHSAYFKCWDAMNEWQEKLKEP